MCSALDHWFLDACGTSQMWRTQLQNRRESSQSDKLCSSLFSAAGGEGGEWLLKTGCLFGNQVH